MKATITIDLQNDQMGETIVETFKSLGEEQRVELCKQVMLEWLRAPWQIELMQREREVLAEMRKEDFLSSDKSEEELRKEWKFRNKLAAHKTSREKMIEEIRKEITRNYTNHTKKMVEEDEQIKSIRQAVVAELVANYPKLVKDAMVAWFSKHLEEVARNMAYERESAGQPAY